MSVTQGDFFREQVQYWPCHVRSRLRYSKNEEEWRRED